MVSMTDSEDFASMFNASQKAKRLSKGQTVEGVIVQIGAEVALVDVGSKSEAVVDVSELKDADGVLEVTVGDRIQATVVSTGGGVMLSRKLARRAATDRQIAAAFESGIPVEGTIQAVVKGGYEVRVGQSRAFCPLSQIDAARTADPAVHVGQLYTFRVVEYSEGGRNIVVSRRALLEEEHRARAAEVRRAIVPGAVLSGRVASVREYGAFIELGGGVQGLLHASEIGWARVTDVGGTLAPGDEITVKVLRVDEGTDKISLSTKALTADPWSAVATKYTVGQALTGRVTRVADFGLFVELEPGIEALAHASTFAATGKRDEWKKTLAGTALPVEILSIEADKRRIGVAVIPAGSTRGMADTAAGESQDAADLREYAARNDAQAATGLGSLADKLRGALGRKNP